MNRKITEELLRDIAFENSDLMSSMSPIHNRYFFHCADEPNLALFMIESAPVSSIKVQVLENVIKKVSYELPSVKENFVKSCLECLRTTTSDKVFSALTVLIDKECEPLLSSITNPYADEFFW